MRIASASLDDGRILLEDERGHVGAAALHGDATKPSDVVHAAAACIEGLLGAAVPRTRDDVKALLLHVRPVPSVRAAIEGALLDLIKAAARPPA